MNLTAVLAMCYDPVNCHRRKQAGVTLIELIISITVISVALVAILGAFSQSIAKSADPAIRAQAASIAMAYMEEVLLQPYADPAGSDTGGCEEGNNRATYDDVNDYNCINDTTGAKDRNNNLIPGLEGYNVQVSVRPSTLNGAAAQEIVVTTTYDGDANLNVSLTAFRVDY